MKKVSPNARPTPRDRVSDRNVSLEGRMIFGRDSVGTRGSADVKYGRSDLCCSELLLAETGNGVAASIGNAGARLEKLGHAKNSVHASIGAEPYTNGKSGLASLSTGNDNDGHSGDFLLQAGSSNTEKSGSTHTQPCNEIVRMRKSETKTRKLKPKIAKKNTLSADKNTLIGFSGNNELKKIDVESFNAQFPIFYHKNVETFHRNFPC